MKTCCGMLLDAAAAGGAAGDVVAANGVAAGVAARGEAVVRRCKHELCGSGRSLAAPARASVIEPPTPCEPQDHTLNQQHSGRVNWSRDPPTECQAGKLVGLWTNQLLDALLSASPNTNSVELLLRCGRCQLRDERALRLSRYVSQDLAHKSDAPNPARIFGDAVLGW